MEKIELSVKHRRELAVEFDTTLQTIRMSLQYVFNSPQAHAIRKRAKEMLLREAEKIAN